MKTESIFHDLHEAQSHESVLTKQFAYTRPMGGYRPKFEGIPEQYYPLTCWEVTKYAMFVLGLIGGTLGVMIGFLFWILASGLEKYTIVWSIIFLVFVVFMIVLFFFGGKGRIREEKRLVIEQQLKQEKMKIKNKEKNFGERHF